MPRLRVLMLAAYPAIGGPLPKLTPLMAHGLRACGCDVAVTGWSAHTAGHEGLVAKAGGRAADLVRVHRLLRTARPDVVYAATAHNWAGMLRDLPLVLSVCRGRPPLVLHFHGSDSQRLGKPGQRAFTALSRLLVRRAFSVMLLSSEEAREWRALCPDVRFDVVVNPFVTPRETGMASPSRPADGRGPTLLTVARLIPEKGVFDLVEAFALLRTRRPCRLVLAGDGPSRGELERRIGVLGLSGDVELAGYVAGGRLDDLYRAADLFVLPTYHPEGLPLSVMEAMGHGLPLVVTPTRGLLDQLVDGVHAVFVPPRDPEGLSRALDGLLADAELRRRMGEANLAHVADFAPDRVVPRYAEILASVAWVAGACGP